MKKNRLSFTLGIIVLSGIFGWIYEIIFYFFNDGCKEIYLRGICFGPWIDIYALGGLFIYLINYKKTNNKLMVFLKSGLICGMIEYIVGLLIYTLFDGKRSWNYNTEILNFFNINGFVCLRSVLFFALSGLILMYILVPLIKKSLESKYKQFFKYLYIILFIIFIFDELYNMLCLLKILPFSKASSIYIKHGFKYWIS